MRPGREIDTQIAEQVFGHRVWAQSKVLYEGAEKGDRPLRKYSREMEWAWEVAEKMKIALIPVVGGQWFAFAAPHEGWESPQAMLAFLEDGDFSKCGASLGSDIPLAICQAALKAAEKRAALAQLSQVDATAAVPSAVPAMDASSDGEIRH